MAQNNDLLVLCSNGLAVVMRELGPAFEQETGCKLDVRLGTANALMQEIGGGAAFDVAILTAPTIDQLMDCAKVVPGTRLDIAQSGVGVTVRPGAPKPDISSAEALKRALREAKSIVFTAQGASGQYFASLLPHLGLEDEVRRKATIPAGGLVAEAVVRGEVELGIQQVSEILAVPGAVLVGPLPDELQRYTIFSAGLGASARNAPLARHLLARLGQSSTKDIARRKGMEPL